MSVYKNNPEGFAKLRKRLVVATSILMLIVVTGIIIYGLIINKDPTSLTVSICLAAFYLVLMFFSLKRTINRQQQIFDSYELHIGETYISRKQQGVPDSRIDNKEIRSITKAANGSILIKSSAPSAMICISPSIQHYNEVEFYLNTLISVQNQGSKNLLQKYAYLFLIVFAVLTITFFITTNRLITLITGTVLLVVLTWSFYKLRKNKNLDVKLRRSAWWSLYLIIIVIISLYYKLVLNYK